MFADMQSNWSEEVALFYITVLIFYNTLASKHATSIMYFKICSCTTRAGGQAKETIWGYNVVFSSA